MLNTEANRPGLAAPSSSFSIMYLSTSVFLCISLYLVFCIVKQSILSVPTASHFSFCTLYCSTFVLNFSFCIVLFQFVFRIQKPRPCSSYSSFSIMYLSTSHCVFTVFNVFHSLNLNFYVCVCAFKLCILYFALSSSRAFYQNAEDSCSWPKASETQFGVAETQ